MELIISNDGLEWTGKIELSFFDILNNDAPSSRMDTVCEFQFYRDTHNSIWVNNIGTTDTYLGKGYITEIIKKVLLQYGEIYFSNAEKFETKNYSPNKGNDFRYNNEISFEKSEFDTQKKTEI